MLTSEISLGILLALVILGFLRIRSFIRTRRSAKVAETPVDNNAHEQPLCNPAIPSPTSLQLVDTKFKRKKKRKTTQMPPDHSSDIDPTAVKQNYDAFLVLDVEATCHPGTDFNYANEIIEWPVCILRWKYKDASGKASRLEVVDEFRSFVKPVWRPELSSFCTTLTGITQDDVDAAPHFSTLMQTSFRDFLVRNGLIDRDTGAHLVRFCWCSDGPWDVRDFVVKQCFLSKMTLPVWLSGDVLDVRRLVARWQEKNDPSLRQRPSTGFPAPRGNFLPLARQLEVLGLGAFQGRQHCGIDDTRNVARIVTELARRGMALKPNTNINPHRRWDWMGKNGKVLEEFITPASTSL